MAQTAFASKSVFRTCVVGAVRAGETLMAKLVEATQSALAAQESTVKSIPQRNLARDSLQLLKQHEAALVKGYAMALLEIFAEGPAPSKVQASPVDSGMDFGELSLMDESEMQDQVELARAQQTTVHATEAVLAELNTLVSSAQGLPSVQPERNPLRPESYIRALQRVVSDTGVAADIRQTWMPPMRDLLGPLLAEQYRGMVSALRDQGIVPVGYAVLGMSAGARSRPETLAAGTGYGGGYGRRALPGGYVVSAGGEQGNAYVNGHMGDGLNSRLAGGDSGWQGHEAASLPAAAQEALLTVAILRQMLAAGDAMGADAHGHSALSCEGVHAAGANGLQPTIPLDHPAPDSPYAFDHAAAEAMEDMAQLERLVGRLSGGQTGPASVWRLSTGHQPMYVVPFVAPTESPDVAAEVVGRMVENLACDPRLLPPVREAVKVLEPVLKQLVRLNSDFFKDAAHPARRLLDEFTQRSLAFGSEEAEGFSQFMRLLNAAVGHLVAADGLDAAPFEQVLHALRSAWGLQEAKARARQLEAVQTARQTEQRHLLTVKIASDIRALADLGQVPVDVIDFAVGPWAEVIARAQLSQQPEVAEDDPGGYLALVPLLLWSAQPELSRLDPGRLTAAIPGMLQKLRDGLRWVDYPAAQASAFLERLVNLHQAAFESPHAVVLGAPPPEALAALLATDTAAFGMDGVVAHVDINLVGNETVAATSGGVDHPYAAFVAGVWVELATNQRVVRTQLTWASPQATLFLFTAPDGSTQSMTRRMRDKLVDSGALRMAPAPPMGSRAVESVAMPTDRTAPRKPSIR